MSVRIFMDVNIGDAEAYKIAMEAYRRAESFLSEVSSQHFCSIHKIAACMQYGFPSTIEALEDEQKDLLQEAYAADPLWSGKGEMSAAKPASINAGRLIIQLNDNVPKTTENFRCLITGEKGKGKSSGKPLHYKGSCFHRIIKGFVCQGGDIVKGDGSGGDSIYNGKFNDEKPGLKGKHDSIGVLSMANSGKNSNTSQFYFTLAPNPKMDGKHVVFGKIVQGIDILQRIDDEAASEDGTPKVEVSIADCGEVPVT